MCHPVAYVGMAIMQYQQEQQAGQQAAQAQNAAAEENAKRQTEAYQNDMASIHAEETNVTKEGFKNAEDAANAKLELLVNARETEAKLKVNNLETIGGGQTADAIMGNLRRNVANQSRDLEDNYQRGVTSLRQEREGLLRDRISRRISYKSAYNSMPTSGYQRFDIAKAGIAGAQGYASYKSYTKVDPAKSQPKNTS
mgnify:FL=1